MRRTYAILDNRINALMVALPENGVSGMMPCWAVGINSLMTDQNHRVNHGLHVAASHEHTYAALEYPSCRGRPAHSVINRQLRPHHSFISTSGSGTQGVQTSLCASVVAFEAPKIDQAGAS